MTNRFSLYKGPDGKFHGLEVDVEIFIIESLLQQRAAKEAESQVLECPEFSDCLLPKERAALELSAPGKSLAKVSAELKGRGFKVSERHVANLIERATEKLRKRLRKVLNSPATSPEFEAIRATVRGLAEEGRVQQELDGEIPVLAPVFESQAGHDGAPAILSMSEEEKAKAAAGQETFETNFEDRLPEDLDDDTEAAELLYLGRDGGWDRNDIEDKDDREDD